MKEIRRVCFSAFVAALLLAPLLVLAVMFVCDTVSRGVA